MSQDPSPHRHAVEVVPDAASLATRAAEWLIEQIARAVERRGRAVVALSGGSTPQAVFACLARHPWRDRIDWDTVHLLWGDERFVPEDDVASNARMTRSMLLDHVDVPASHVYPIPADPGGAPDQAFDRAHVAAEVYATTLHALYGGDRLHDDRPLFDVVMMGLGENGHTASLFPDTPALDERDAWVVPVQTDDTKAPVRITLTYPVLESTHAMVFLVGGKSKHAVVQRVLGGDASLPATRVRPLGGLLWILDQDAATG